jgi:DNA-binding NtrC family response regulator/tetratricopeptide (TPR) repeat protein
LDPLTQILGESPGLVAVRDQVRRLLQRQSDARRMPPVVIQGETGTGKGLLARAMHAASVRARGPFIDVNCAAIPETLLEAEMFGVERGAFTDARQAKPGLFQLANTGTIFLDEIGLLPEALQAKLLKALEERAVRRLGGTRTESVDVWVLAATNEDLAEATRAHRFREDLYHRLAVITVSMPPLRERGGDILRLAEHFLNRACADYGLAPKTLTAAARSALTRYRWPGNIRELGNAMERVALLSQEAEVGPEALNIHDATAAAEPAPPSAGAASLSLESAVADVEREHLLRALEATDWNVTRAAAQLGVSRNTLRYRIEKHGLHPGTSAARPSRKVEAERSVARPGPAAQPAVPEAPPVIEPVRRGRRRLALLRAALALPPGPRTTTPTRAIFDLFREKVATFGGRIEELNTSGIVAVFGLEPVEDAPVRAAHAAMAMVNGLRHRRHLVGDGMVVRLAIHVDQFLIEEDAGVASLDHESWLHAWTLLGSLVEAAEPDGIVVSDVATPFLERRFKLAPAGAPATGVDHVYQLVGQDGRKFGRSIAQFVGRQHELALLRSRLETAARGQGQVAGISGEAGIGKSRLLFEFRRAVLELGASYLEGHCLSYGAEIPYLPVLDILRTTFGMTDHDTPEIIGAKVRTTLAEAGLDPEEDARYLLYLMGIKEDNEDVAALQPDMIKIRVYETLRQLYLRHGQRQPLVMVVEDFQWIDPASEDFFLRFVDAVVGTRILLVATYRSGYRPRWIEKSYATQVALQPLASNESAAVVRSVFDSEQVDDAFVDQIVKRAEGNPFFLEELASSVREQGALALSSMVPETVQEVLLARIERLPAPARGLLQSAAAIGRTVPLALLRAAADVPDEQLVEALRQLQAAEFLYQSAAGPAPEYTFKHALTHDVAYETLLDQRRTELHGAVGQAIERLYAHQLEEQAAILSYHYARSDRHDKAVEYALVGGDRAARLYANTEARTCYEQALALARNLPPSPRSQRWEIDAAFKLAAMAITRQDFEQVQSELERARALSEGLSDEARSARALYWLGRVEYVRGNFSTAIDFANRSLSIADRLGDEALAAPSVNLMGRVYWWSDLPRASQMLERNIEQMRRLGDKREEATAAGFAGMVFGRRGQFERGLAHANYGLQIAQDIRNPFAEAAAYNYRATIRAHMGDCPEAIADYEEARRVAEGVGDLFRIMMVRFLEGQAYTMMGEAARGLGLIEESLALADKIGTPFALAWQKTVLGTCLLTLGRYAEALAVSEDTIRVAQARGDRFAWAVAKRTLGDCLVGLHGTAEPAAEQALDEAIRTLREIGAEPALARAHASYARLLRLKGESDKAREHFAQARRMFQEMGMARDLALAEQIRPPD